MSNNRTLFALLPVRSVWKPLLVVAGAAALGACATIPAPLAGAYPALLPSQAAQGGGASGTQVRWGGEIIKTRPEAHKTCFFVLSRPLDNQARPLSGSDSDGRFMACHSGFYDPEVFTKGREVTFTGTLHGIVSHMVGKYDYAYPRLDAQTVYLWPKRPRYVRYGYADPFYDPFWGPIGPWYNPYWYYQPRRVIIVRPPPPPPPKSGSH